MIHDTSKNQNMIWVDMEMSGLNPETDRVLEIAIVITDRFLQPLAQSQSLVIYQKPQVLSRMDEWNTDQHYKSGLVEEVERSTVCEHDAERQLLKLVSESANPRQSAMCGNSIHQDRRFMRRYMPTLEEYFHYRNIDVSSLKELIRRWNPELLKGFSKTTSNHRALDDVFASIAELRYYREHFLKCKQVPE